MEGLIGRRSFGLNRVGRDAPRKNKQRRNTGILHYVQDDDS